MQCRSVSSPLPTPTPWSWHCPPLPGRGGTRPATWSMRGWACCKWREKDGGGAGEGGQIVSKQRINFHVTRTNTHTHARRMLPPPPPPPLSPSSLMRMAVARGTCKFWNWTISLSYLAWPAKEGWVDGAQQQVRSVESRITLNMDAEDRGCSGADKRVWFVKESDRSL